MLKLSLKKDITKHFFEIDSLKRYKYQKTRIKF